jgi:hypothetical protein
MGKHLIAIFASAVALAGVMLFAGAQNNGKTMKPDDNGHMLSDLWSQYYKAKSKDKPETAASVLSEIMDKAKDARYSYDYWDAAEKYMTTRRSVNWKLSDSLRLELKKNVEAYDEPIVTFSYREEYENDGTSALFEWAKGEKGRLSASRTEPFYTSLGNMMSGTLPEYVENDWQYVLWSLSDFDEGDLATAELLKTLDGKYPAADYAEFLVAQNISDDEARTSKLKELAAKGTAVSFFPRASLLSDEFSALQNKESSTSDDYKAFAEKCRTFEKERKALTGKEAAIVKDCKSVASIIISLESKELEVHVEGDTVSVVFRNLPSAKVSMFKDSKTDKVAIMTKEVKNPNGDFYVKDTVSFMFGPVDDGAYYVVAENGKTKGSTVFVRHTISMAVRKNSDGMGIYVADYKTGKPLEKATVVLSRNGKEISRVADFALGKGFTALPEELSSKINDDRQTLHSYALRAEYRDEILRSSDDVKFYSNDYDGKDGPVIGHNVLIMTDRSAFNPGDTVNFKAVLYSGDMVSTVGTSGKGIKVKAVLRDSEGNDLENKSLVTNEFGSVASSFALPEGKRNGFFSIMITANGGYSGNKSFRVDEFVLPTFDVSFEPVPGVILPGDTVTVRGKVNSYSGHSLSEARISYKAGLFNGTVSEGTLSPSSDGSFAIPVATDPGSSWAWYNVTLNIKDNTGETHEYSQSFLVCRTYSMDIDISNDREGEISIDDDELRVSPYRWYPEGADSDFILSDASAKTVFDVSRRDGQKVEVPVSYKIVDENGKTFLSGETTSGKEVTLDLSKAPGGIITINAEAFIPSHSGPAADTLKCTARVLRLSDDSVSLDADVDRVFLPAEDKSSATAILGSTDGETWAVAELYGKDRKLLADKVIYLSGEKGGKGSLAKISFPYKDEYPGAVRLMVFFFKNGQEYEYDHVYAREPKSLSLPLSFTSFQDKTLPDHEYTLRAKTLPGVEAVAAVFDKSVETIASNTWRTVTMGTYPFYDSDLVDILSSCSSGNYGLQGSVLGFNEEVVVAGYGARPRRMAMTKAADSAVESVAAEAADVPEAPSAEMVRDVFRTTLAFEPFLRSSDSGEIEIPLKTSGKLSTYKVQIFAHTKDMHNAVLDSEMVVTIPVKVSVVEPKYLYYGDKYQAAVSVSGNTDEPVSGTMAFYQYDGTDYRNSKPVASSAFKVTVPAGGSVSRMFDVQVPASASSADVCKSGTIGLLAVFFAGDNEASADFSDAVFVKIPLLGNSQKLTEAHSGVLLPGMSADSLRNAISSRFTGTSAYGAETSEISIIDMVREAIPTKADPSGNDLLSLSEAWYVRKVAASLGVDVSQETITDSALEERIAGCINADGGFSWFEGMQSSPVITAVVLERFSKAAALPAGIDESKIDAAVKFLDDNQFSISRPMWCGGMSDEQYMYIRSLYPSVKFEVEAPAGRSKEFSKRISEFRKSARQYLVPSGDRGLNGYILAKARRLTTLLNLLEDKDGTALVKEWGIRFSSASKIRSSAYDDVASLLEYAVDHPDGGTYYPNAVMPFRGLLESEAYAHAMICDLMTRYSGSGSMGKKSDLSGKASEVADGIRIWLMLQKETQHWDSEPAYVDAIASVMAGSDEVKSVKVIVMTKSYEKPFSEIKSAGNDFTVERKFFREETVKKTRSDGKTVSETVLKPIEEGTVLSVGDKITVEYQIWSKENRSFVKLTSPREASLRPVDQLSGYSWGLGRFRPMVLDGWYTYTPCGYRNVRTDRTEYYFDSYPEESTTVSEKFFVTQAGSFTAPVVEVESLYAPHYRANSAWAGALDSETEN